MDRRALQEQIRARRADESGELRGPGPFRAALAYPSPYHVGMSSLGFQAIYRVIHQAPGWTGERAFLPDDVEAHRATRAPLFTYESETPVAELPVLALSVAYELELSGVFALLELAGLPVMRAERGPQHPLVVAGGPLTFSNPAPLEPFVDVIVQGEGEELIARLLAEVEGADGRDGLLTRLAAVPGLWVCGRSEPQHRFFVAKADDACLPAHSQIVTPHTELRNMFLVEPARGCSRGCHYCVMRRTTNQGMRLVDVEKVLALIPPHARRVGLVGAAVTDHPRIVELLERITSGGREVGVSSLRADRLTLSLVRALRAGGAKVLTVASDGASQRLRDQVDRKHSEEQLLEAARLARACGMERLKVYNMVGLPGEADADLDELVSFSRELSRVLPVVLGVAPFVAKRHTPMDGAPFAGVKEIERRLERLRRGLRGAVEVRPVSARWAYVEHMLAQGGAEAGLAAYDAYREKGSYAAFQRAFAQRDVRPFEAARTEDGRRRSVTWPSVGPQGRAQPSGPGH